MIDFANLINITCCPLCNKEIEINNFAHHSCGDHLIYRCTKSIESNYVAFHGKEISLVCALNDTRIWVSSKHQKLEPFASIEQATNYFLTAEQSLLFL